MNAKPEKDKFLTLLFCKNRENWGNFTEYMSQLVMYCLSRLINFTTAFLKLHIQTRSSILISLIGSF